MVGLGTQDSLSLAKKFVSRTKVKSFPMLWDKTGKSWSALGVRAQPAWMLIATDGKVIDAQLGEIPYAEILNTIA